MSQSSIKKKLLLTIISLGIIYIASMLYAQQRLKVIVAESLKIDHQDVKVSAHPHKIDVSILKDKVKADISLNLLSNHLSISSSSIQDHMKSIGGKYSETLKEPFPISFDEIKNLDLTIKLNSRMETLSYLRKDRIELFDLFNLSDKATISFNMLCNQDKPDFFKRNYAVSADVSLPDKKTYENIEDIAKDIPRKLIVKTSAVDKGNYDKSKLPSYKELIAFLLEQPTNLDAVKDSLTIEFDLKSAKTFPTDENYLRFAIDILKDSEIKIDYLVDGDHSSSSSNFDLKNTQDSLNISSKTQFRISRDQEALFKNMNKQWNDMSSDDKAGLIIDPINSVLSEELDHNNIKILKINKAVIKFIIEKFDQLYKADNYVAYINENGNHVINLNIPRNDNSKHTDYSFNIFDILSLKGSLQGLSLDKIDIPSNNEGLLSLNNLDFISNLSAAAGTVFFSFSYPEDVSNDVVAANYDKLFTQVKKLLGEISDNPAESVKSNISTYSYSINVNDMMQSKFSKTMTFGEAFSKGLESFANINLDLPKH